MSPVPRPSALQSLAEGVVGNAWATDVAGKFTYVTPAALLALGTTLEEINSDTGDGHFAWRRIIHPDDYDAAAALWRRCLRTGEHYDIEHRLLRPSGAYGWGRSSGQPLRDGEERITGWYGTVIDTDVRSAISKRLSDVTGSAHEEKAAPDVPRALGLIHPDDRDAAAHAAARAFWTGVPQVTRHLPVAAGRQLSLDRDTFRAGIQCQRRRRRSGDGPGAAGEHSEPAGRAYVGGDKGGRSRREHIRQRVGLRRGRTLEISASLRAEFAWRHAGISECRAA